MNHKGNLPEFVTGKYFVARLKSNATTRVLQRGEVDREFELTCDQTIEFTGVLTCSNCEKSSHSWVLAKRGDDPDLDRAMRISAYYIFEISVKNHAVNAADSQVATNATI